jgi:hypothetical protein
MTVYKCLITPFIAHFLGVETPVVVITVDTSSNLAHSVYLGQILLFKAHPDLIRSKLWLKLRVSSLLS